jgi:hypothetical protein
MSVGTNPRQEKITTLFLHPTIRRAMRIRCAETDTTMREFVSSTLAKALGVKLDANGEPIVKPSN